jgi:hypothetical protein
MGATKLAVFVALQTTGHGFFIFACRVILPFALCTRKRDNFSHK